MRIGNTGLYVIEKDLGDKNGYYNEQTGEIAIHINQTIEQKFEILIHELIHASETACINQKIIKRRVGEKWVEAMAANLSLLLLEGDYLNTTKLEEK